MQRGAEAPRLMCRQKRVGRD